MRIAFILKLAFKNLTRYKLRTFLTSGGVAISIGFITFLVSLGYGLQKVSTDQIANLDALQILDISAGKSKIVSINEDVVEDISSFSEVEKIYPEVSVASQISFGTSKSDGVTYGKNLDLISLEKPKISYGGLFSSNKSDEVVLNGVMAKKLGINDPKSVLGETLKVNMIIRQELLSAEEKVSKRTEKTVKIVGFLDEGSTPYLYIPLDSMKMDGIERYSSAKVKVKGKENVDKVKLEVEHMGFSVNSIKDTVDQVNQFFAVFRIILLGFGVISVIVACLGMFNTLTISLLEKTREIGLMKALGATKKDILKIFITESLLIGVSGGIFGLLGSYFLGEILNASIATLAKSTGNISVTLFVFPLSLVSVALVLSLIISVLTGLYPAGRASKISALNALRYE